MSLLMLTDVEKSIIDLFRSFEYLDYAAKHGPSTVILPHLLSVTVNMRRQDHPSQQCKYSSVSVKYGSVRTDVIRFARGTYVRTYVRARLSHSSPYIHYKWNFKPL